MKKYFLNHKYLTIAYLLAAIFASFMTVCIASVSYTHLTLPTKA